MIPDSIHEQSPEFKRFQPLPERAERNRRRLRVYLALYVTVSSLLAATAIVAGVYLTVGLIALRAGSEYMFLAMSEFTVNLPLLIGATWIACLPVFGLWCLRAILRPASALLGRLMAVPASTGGYSRAKSALHDAVIAAGAPMPRLAVVCDQSVNAFVLAHDRETAWVGVTQGLLDLLNQDELRCVFAHLLVRVRDGSALTASVLAALFYDATVAARIGDAVAEAYAPHLEDGREARLLKALGSPVILLYGMIRLCMGIASLVILVGYRQSHALLAESADSDGMLLTRDPEGMLGALEKVLPADNRPGDVWHPWRDEYLFGALSFAWPTMSFSDDPELVRILRMREVLGAAGA